MTIAYNKTIRMRSKRRGPHQNDKVGRQMTTWILEFERFKSLWWSQNIYLNWSLLIPMLNTLNQGSNFLKFPCLTSFTNFTDYFQQPYSEPKVGVKLNIDSWIRWCMKGVEVNSRFSTYKKNEVTLLKRINLIHLFLQRPHIFRPQIPRELLGSE